jgi:hypothetical protein
MATSPIVAGDLVILSCDQTKGSYLLALDRANGRRRWHAARPEATLGWSVPIVYSPQRDENQLILLGSTRLDSYYLATGERRWWLPVATEGSMGSPVIHNDALLIYAAGHDQPWMETFEATLSKYDRDKDGRVSQEEFRADKDWYEHFGWIDANRDGFLQAAEWTAARSFGMGDYGILSIQPGSASGQLPADAVRWRFSAIFRMSPLPSSTTTSISWCARVGSSLPSTPRLVLFASKAGPIRLWASIGRLRSPLTEKCSC